MAKRKRKAVREGKRTLPTDGEKARKLRKHLNLTQRALATLANVSYHKIIDIEKGRGAEPYIIDIVARKLGKTLNDLAPLVDELCDASKSSTTYDLPPDLEHAKAVLEDTPLSGECRATFTSTEDAEAAREFLRGLSLVLASQPAIIDFRYTRKVNTILIGFDLRPHWYIGLIRRFGEGLCDYIGFGEQQHGSVLSFHLPRRTLAWPLFFFPTTTSRRYYTIQELVTFWVREHSENIAAAPGDFGALVVRRLRGSRGSSQ
jgi:DNA-binding XRE family transcriptional regulator